MIVLYEKRELQCKKMNVRWRECRGRAILMVVVEDAFGPQENNHQGQQQGVIHQQHIEPQCDKKEKRHKIVKNYISPT